MHCPRCGHQQNSNKTSFCTKCGLEIGDVKKLLVPELRESKAKRKREANRAARQGMLIIFFGFGVILILAILRDFMTVPKSLFAIAVLIFIIGGAVRMSLPLLFGNSDLEGNTDDIRLDELDTNILSGAQILGKSLPEAEFRPPLDFGAKRYDTNELPSPSSVTEPTTRKLELEEEFQPK